MAPPPHTYLRQNIVFFMSDLLSGHIVIYINWVSRLKNMYKYLPLFGRSEPLSEDPYRVADERNVGRTTSLSR